MERGKKQQKKPGRLEVTLRGLPGVPLVVDKGQARIYCPRLKLFHNKKKGDWWGWVY